MTTNLISSESVKENINHIMTAALPTIKNERWFQSFALEGNSLLLDNAIYLDSSSSLNFFIVLCTLYNEDRGKNGSLYFPVAVGSANESNNIERGKKCIKVDLNKKKYYVYEAEDIASFWQCVLNTDYKLDNNTRLFFEKKKQALFEKINIPSQNIIDSTNKTVFLKINNKDYFCKSYRKTNPYNREIEIINEIASKKDACISNVLGYLNLKINNEKHCLAIIQEKVSDSQDVFSLLVDHISQYLQEETNRSFSTEKTIMALVKKTAETTAKLHTLFELIDSTALVYTKENVNWFKKRLKLHVFTLTKKIQTYSANKDQSIPNLSKEWNNIAKDIELILGSTNSFSNNNLQITHSDYHLGQVIQNKKGCQFVVDFEGEPSRSQSDNDILYPVERDIAGIIRSFDYAMWEAIRLAINNEIQFKNLVQNIVNHQSNENITLSTIVEKAKKINEQNKKTFIATYNKKGKKLNLANLNFWVIEKVIYEIEYEIGNRPQFVHIPFLGLLECISFLKKHNKAT